MARHCGQGKREFNDQVGDMTGEMVMEGEQQQWTE
jgi:hypothetical protein